MGKDAKGISRGRCSKQGCDCVEYLYEKENGHKCANCGHVPIKHTHEEFHDSDETLDGTDEELSIYSMIKDDSIPLMVENNRDIRGCLRGACTNPGCNCRKFSYIEEKGPKCSECGHVPAQHTRLILKPAATPHEFVEENHGDAALFSISHKKIPSNTLLSDLRITDVEEDQTPPMISVSKSKPIPKKRQAHSCKSVSSIDGRHPMSLPVRTDPVLHKLSTKRDGHFSQQSFTSLQPTAPTVAVATPQPFIQQPSVQQTCKLAGCNNPVCVEPSGRVHEFCCRGHASDYSSIGVPPHLKCFNPLCERMKYKENEKYFNFCGLSCRDSYRKSQQQDPQDTTATASLFPVSSQKPKVSPENACLLPGCYKPKHYDSANNCHLDYCGQNHAEEAKKNLIKKASRQEFQRIQAHFNKSWDPRKGTCGQLHTVFIIDNPKLKYQFQKYCSSLSVKTVNQYYHGTSLKCAIYQNTTVCSDHTCGICGVSQKGMLPNFKAKNIKFQRFGDGFYLAPNSSKCHDYTQGHNIYRAMLLFDVAEGNKYILQKDQTKLTAPPSGYDSVYGKHGGNLNYDEIVLFKSEAVVPTHIVVYIKDGIHKIAK